MNSRLLEVKGLTVQFHTPDGPVEVVSSVDFHVKKGETVGLVGESGCGKSVSSMAIMGLIRRETDRRRDLVSGEKPACGVS
ncbi:ATP-binding cassette domain-containing protein [Brevibacillus panacihumi]|uniref:ATP-binding cassette domain-containing protein n=1 Tax=Brevibacillus panacihumi TaxID=497735 RepID=UPI003D1AD607